MSDLLERFQLETQIARLRAESAELRAALDEVTLCPTCDGDGMLESDCEQCLYGYPHGKCEQEEFECPHCEGSGRLWNDSEKAKVLCPGINPSPEPAERATGQASADGGVA